MSPNEIQTAEQPAEAQVIHIGDEDIGGCLSDVLKNMNAIRQEGIQNNKAEKEEYTRLVLRLASFIEALAGDTLNKNIDIITEEAEKNPALLSYDYLQDKYWQENNPRFAKTLDAILIEFKEDDFVSLAEKHHLFNAIKYLKSGKVPEEKRAQIQATISSHNPLEQKTVSAELAKYGINAENFDDLTVEAKNSEGYEFLARVLDYLGFTGMRTNTSREDFLRMYKTISEVSEKEARKIAKIKGKSKKLQEIVSKKDREHLDVLKYKLAKKEAEVLEQKAGLLRSQFGVEYWKLKALINENLENCACMPTHGVCVRSSQNPACMGLKKNLIALSDLVMKHQEEVGENTTPRIKKCEPKKAFYLWSGRNHDSNTRIMGLKRLEKILEKMDTNDERFRYHAKREGAKKNDFYEWIKSTWKDCPQILNAKTPQAMAHAVYSLGEEMQNSYVASIEATKNYLQNKEEGRKQIFLKIEELSEKFRKIKELFRTCPPEEEKKIEMCGSDKMAKLYEEMLGYKKTEFEALKKELSPEMEKINERIAKKKSIADSIISSQIARARARALKERDYYNAVKYVSELGYISSTLKGYERKKNYLVELSLVPGEIKESCRSLRNPTHNYHSDLEKLAGCEIEKEISGCKNLRQLFKKASDNEGLDFTEFQKKSSVTEIGNEFTLNFYDVFETGPYKKISALFYKKDLRYAMTYITATNTVSRQIDLVSRILFNLDWPIKEKLAKISDATNANYIHLSEITPGNKPRPYKKFRDEN